MGDTWADSRSNFIHLLERRNAMKSFKTVTVAFVAIVVLFAHSVAWGQNPKQTSVMIYYGFSMSFPQPCYLYDASVEEKSVVPGSTWGNSKLITSKGRYLTHIAEGTLTYPADPFEHYGSLLDPSVVWNVNFYWDQYLYRPYPGWFHIYGVEHPDNYDKVTGPDPSRNCHGYSTGKDVDLWDFMRLMEDDYTPIEEAGDLVAGAIVGRAGYLNNGNWYSHSIRIDEIDPVFDQGNIVKMKVVRISEKWRDSGVYTKVPNQVFFADAPVELELPTTVSGLGCWRIIEACQ